MSNFQDRLSELEGQYEEIKKQESELSKSQRSNVEKLTPSDLEELEQRYSDLKKHKAVIGTKLWTLEFHREKCGEFVLPDDDYIKLHRGEVTLASGDAEGTEFRILLKRRTERERAIVFASVTGFTRMGFYWLNGFPQDLLEQAASQGPSIHFAQILHGPTRDSAQIFPNKPHEAIVWCTLADDPIIRKYEFKQGFYYSMYYAAIELMIENGYNQIHLAGLNQHGHTSEEVLGGIKSFVHVARQSKIEKLDLVIGGVNYWDLHYGGYDYLETIKAFVQKAIVSEFVPVKTRIDDNNESFKDKRNPGSYYPEVKQFNIQSRILDVPYRLQSV